MKEKTKKDTKVKSTSVSKVINKKKPSSSVKPNSKENQCSKRKDKSNLKIDSTQEQNSKTKKSLDKNQVSTEKKDDLVDKVKKTNQDANIKSTPKKKKVWKKVLISIASVFMALILVVGGYLIYVVSAYYRIEDNLALAVNNKSNNIVQVGTNYKVTSWNTGFASYSQDFSFFMDGGEYSRAYNKEEVYKNMDGIVSSLQSINSDFTLLQEVDINSTRSYHVNEKDYYLSKVDSNFTFALNYDSPYLFWPLLSPHGKSVSGLLSMSNFKIESSVRRSLPIDDGFSKFLDLDRCYTKNVLPTSNGKNLVLYNVHLSAYSSNESMVTKQVEILVDDMKEEYLKGNYTICGGDFNKDLLGNSGEIFGVSGEDYTWAKAFPTSVLPEGISLIANHNDNVPSCRNCDTGYQDGKTFVITIDGFLISENVDFVSYNVHDLKFMNSDHNPVTMEFVLKA